MTQANPKDTSLPVERFVHYLELAARAYEAARHPSTEVRMRNLYTWIGKSWEMLAMDEIDKARRGEAAETSPRGRRTRRTRTPA